jgi:chitinase
MIRLIHTSLMSLNNSKFFSGLVMIMLNIGSKYITIELSKTQEEYLRNSVGRQILIFSICWMGTRDIYLALALTAIFEILTQYLFNENSKFCILPKYVIALSNAMDTNNDGKVSESEIRKAIEILNKAKKDDLMRQKLEAINVFA